MTELQDYPIVIERPLAWGQMDAFQHVNNVEYFRFFQEVRITYFEAMEIHDPDGAGSFADVSPILAATSCRYLAPLTYPDDIAIGARTTDIGDDRFTLEYAVYSEDAGRIVTVGDSEVVPYNLERGHKVDIPDAWRRAIEAIEAIE